MHLYLIGMNTATIHKGKTMNQYDYEKSARKHLPTLTIDTIRSDCGMQVSGHDHHGVDFCEQFDQEDWEAVCNMFNCHLYTNTKVELILANLEDEIDSYMKGFKAPFTFTDETQSEINEGVTGIALKFAKQLID